MTSSGRIWGAPIGTPCPVPAPTAGGRTRPSSARSPTVSAWRFSTFFRRGSVRTKGQPIDHPLKTFAMLLKGDLNLGAASRLATSYNFNHSRKENETFDVADLRLVGQRHRRRPGPHQRRQRELLHHVRQQQAERVSFHVFARDASANGERVEPDRGHRDGLRAQLPLRQPVLPAAERRRADLAHADQGQHLDRPRQAYVEDGRRMDAHAQRPGVPRLLHRPVSVRQRRRISALYRRRRRRAGSAPGRLVARMASYVTLPTACPAGTTTTGGPLLFYLQGAGRTGLATDAAGASTVANEELSLFIQDQWQVSGQPHAAVRLAVGCAADAGNGRPATTAFGPFLNDPRFPSDGTIPDQGAMWQPRAGATWDVRGNGRSVLRASAGIYFARQNMLSQVGSVTTNGLQQQTLFVSTDNVRQFGAVPPAWPGVLTPAPVPAGQFPLFTRRSRLPSRLREPAHLHVQRRLRAGSS